MRFRLLSSCAPKRATAKPALFATTFSRAFFTEHADISKREVIIPIAERFGISASDLETAWHERRFCLAVDDFINRGAIVGLMSPTELVLRLPNEAPERLRE